MKCINNFLQELLLLNNKQIDKNFMYIGQGIARKVYAINDNYVLKLAKGLDGYYQNNVENHVYNNIEEDLLKYLCPIVAFSPRIIIMKRAIPLSKLSHSKKVNINSLRKDKNALSDLNYMVNKFYLYPDDIVSTGSWGKLGDKYVLVDYGCTSEKGDYFYRSLFGI